MPGTNDEVSDVKRLCLHNTHESFDTSTGWFPLDIWLTLYPDIYVERKQAGGNFPKYSSSPLACQPPTGILGQSVVVMCRPVSLQASHNSHRSSHHKLRCSSLSAEAGRFASPQLTTLSTSASPTRGMLLEI